ncbi:MAG: hypothetical protein Q8K63_10680, partial [Acidimicrobiales bacterium]|nr:hypothetical protein [Acidimicrobiales bacterium]
MSCVFIRWCVRRGEAERELLTAITDRDNPLLHIPRLYGKAQTKNPARWLTYDAAFGKLLATCNDGTELGLRDEVVRRLGLAGMRLTEVLNLEHRNFRFRDDPPLIRHNDRLRRIEEVQRLALVDVQELRTL